MTVDDAMKPDAPILHASKLRNKEDGDKPTNVAEPLPVQARRYRGRLQSRGLHRRARVQHRDGPSGLYRAAQRGRHLQLRRPRHGLLLDPGRLRRALDDRAGARDSRSARSRSCRRRSAAASAARLSDLSRTALRCCCRRRPARPVKMVMTRARSAARHRTDFGLDDQSQDGRDQGRQNHRRPGLDGLRGGRLSGLAGRRRRDVPRSRRTRSTISTIDGYDVVVNRPKTAAYRAPGATNAAFASETVHRRVGRQVRNRSDRFPDQERVQGRHSADGRTAVQADRLYRRPARRSRTASITSPS